MSALYSKIPVFSEDIEPKAISVDALIEKACHSANGLRIFDVRRAEAFARQPVMIKGAQRLEPWQIPSGLGQVRRELSVSSDSCHLLVMVCVYGHAVSQTACGLALCHGFQAAFLDGGMDAWLRAGLPTSASKGAL